MSHLKLLLTGTYYPIAKSSESKLSMSSLNEARVRCNWNTQALLTCGFQLAVKVVSSGSCPYCRPPAP